MSGKFDKHDHFWFLRERQDVLRCCYTMDNLVVYEQANNVMKAVCKVCGRKHVKMLAEPGRIWDPR